MPKVPVASQKPALCPPARHPGSRRHPDPGWGWGWQTRVWSPARLCDCASLGTSLSLGSSTVPRWSRTHDPPLPLGRTGHTVGLPACWHNYSFCPNCFVSALAFNGHACQEDKFNHRKWSRDRPKPGGRLVDVPPPSTDHPPQASLEAASPAPWTSTQLPVGLEEAPAPASSACDRGPVHWAVNNPGWGGVGSQPPLPSGDGEKNGGSSMRPPDKSGYGPWGVSL